MSNNLAFITSINAAKLRLLSELEDGNEKTSIFDATNSITKPTKHAKPQRKQGRLHNRVAAGKQPVGVLPPTQQKVLSVLLVL